MSVERDFFLDCVEFKLDNGSIFVDLNFKGIATVTYYRPGNTLDEWEKCYPEEYLYKVVTKEIRWTCEDEYGNEIIFNDEQKKCIDKYAQEYAQEYAEEYSDWDFTYEDFHPEPDYYD